MAEFIALLEARSVQYVCDVRSIPVSRHAPEFCQAEMRKSLLNHGIAYVPMGKLLGGRPEDSSSYSEDGRVDYHILQRSPQFQQGIDRVVNGVHEGWVLALFCSEAAPERCHRSKAIGKALSDRGVQVLHIESNDIETPQEKVMMRLAPPLTLLALEPDLRNFSRKAYR